MNSSKAEIINRPIFNTDWTSGLSLSVLIYNPEVFSWGFPFFSQVKKSSELFSGKSNLKPRYPKVHLPLAGIENATTELDSNGTLR